MYAFHFLVLLLSLAAITFRLSCGAPTGPPDDQDKTTKTNSSNPDGDISRNLEDKEPKKEIDENKNSGSGQKTGPTQPSETPKEKGTVEPAGINETDSTNNSSDVIKPVSGPVEGDTKVLEKDKNKLPVPDVQGGSDDKEKPDATNEHTKAQPQGDDGGPANKDDKEIIQKDEGNNEKTTVKIMEKTQDENDSDGTDKPVQKDKGEGKQNIDAGTSNDTTSGQGAIDTRKKGTETETPPETTVTTSTTEAFPQSSWSADDQGIDIDETSLQDRQGGNDENENRNAQNKQQKSQPVSVKVDYSDQFEEESSSGHFMAYFLTATVLCIAGYVIFHNKQKIIAFIVEGRNTHGRRPSTKSYQKLKTKVDDVLPSLEKSTTNSNYVY